MKNIDLAYLFIMTIIFADIYDLIIVKRFFVDSIVFLYWHSILIFSILFLICEYKERKKLND
jgi:uncharacterized membrane protein YraQ (UPF0718 family)